MSESPQPFRILAVCTGNTCRSPQLEGILRQRFAARPEVEVFSCGLGVEEEGAPASEHAVTVMREIGLDLSQHQSTQITGEDLNSANLVVCLGGSHLDVIADWANQYSE